MFLPPFEGSRGGMTNGQSDVSDADDATASPLPIELLRERAKARRRSERLKAESWNIVRARRQKVRMIALCAGALLLMGIGLYFQLSRQDPPPADSLAPVAAVTIIA
jgi:hypothetical protein